MKQGSTGLTLRELQVYRVPAVELSAKKIKLWIEQLPVANLGESSQSIYRLLMDINQTIVEPNLRLTILNTIEPIASEQVDSLERLFINNHISLTDKQRKIAALVQAIQTELCLSYHAAIESIITEGIKRSTKRLLAKAICLAIKYHGLIILRCYQLYASVPGRIWRELYRLYLLAREHQIETMETQYSKSGEMRSAKSIFTQIMLLGIADPYKLRQSEIGLVWEILPTYTEYCSLESHAYNKHPFFINLNSNTPPVQKSLYKEKPDENRLKVSVVSVIEQLKIDLSQLTENARYSARKTMVYKHLIHCWSQGTQRSFARTTCQDGIQVSIGLGATHYLLMESFLQKQTPDIDDRTIEIEPLNRTLDAMEGSLRDATLAIVAPKKDRLEANSYRNYLSTSAITSKDVWAKLYSTDQAASEQEQEKRVEKRSREAIARDSYKIQKCELINMSPGGYCLQIPSPGLPKHTQTGEIIGFIEGESTNQSWSIGIVRWVKRLVKINHIQMGVQLLAPDVVPINVQLKNSRSEENIFQRALLLPALTGVGQEATIITNPLAFNINSKLRVMEVTQEYDVRLTKEISSSGSSRQFSFEKTTSVIDKKNKQPAILSANPDDEDGVWDFI